jgi:acyl carrier protein
MYWNGGANVTESRRSRSLRVEERCSPALDYVERSNTDFHKDRTMGTGDSLDMSLQSEIRHFILQNFLFTDDEAALSDSESLMEKGVIDSTGVLELIMHLEERYAIKVNDEELLPANLDSIARIAAFVQRKLVA